MNETKYTPIVLMHGIFAPSPLVHVNDLIKKHFGESIYVKMIFMGTSFSAIHEVQKQGDLLAQEIQNDPLLKNGFNLIAHSQGGLLSRYYIEHHNTPPVYNFITLASPHAGQLGIPSEIDEEYPWLKDIGTLGYTWLYSTAAQEKISFSNYWKDTLHYQEYLNGCIFLPYLNNEKPHPLAAQYKKNIESLHNFLMVCAQKEEIIEPKESEHFGYYKKGSNTQLETFFESEQYTNNLLGLRTLHDEGRLHFAWSDTTHREIDKDEECFLKYIVPLIKLDTSNRATALIPKLSTSQEQITTEQQQQTSSKPLLFVANWKMNVGIDAGITFYKNNRAELVALSNATNGTIILCPEFPLLRAMAGFFENCGIHTGAQDCSAFEKGAYTGEVSARTIAETKATYCIVGHSERRTLFGESNEDVAKKAGNLLANNVTPIICVGETADQQAKNETIAVLQKQLEPVLSMIKTRFPSAQYCIAYEPVWAIGTNKTPDAQTLSSIFNWLAQYCAQEAPQGQVQLLYGGSVDTSNAPLFHTIEKLNGFMIGGASTDFIKFKSIIMLCYEHLESVKKLA